MSREEILTFINLREDLISPDRPNRNGVIINPTKITIHNTSNTKLGADANAHSRFVRNTGYYITKDKLGNETKNWVSWHFTVDDRIAIKHLPTNEKAIHAGSDANNTSIAIEICMHNGIDQEAANNRAAQLVALLCYDLSIKMDGITTHQHWTGKNCPELLLKQWDKFIDDVDIYFQQLSLPSPAYIDDDSRKKANLPTADISLCWTNSVNEPIAEISNIRSQISVRNGFNQGFLKAGNVELPVYGEGHERYENYTFIHHQNISTYFNGARKLALYTACNFNKLALIDGIERSNTFRDDPLLDLSSQLGDGFYRSTSNRNIDGHNYFDRGHIIARRYNQWGQTKEQAMAGERDTYFFTSIYPQVKELNQDEWEKLESFIIDEGRLAVQKVSIISGAILGTKDPHATYIHRYYGKHMSIQIPEVFWKVIYYEVSGELRKIAFLMSQRNRLSELPIFNLKATDNFIAEDPFHEIADSLKTFIINSSVIEEGTKLIFSAAKELYQIKEPLEVVITDNDTHPHANDTANNNILQFI